MQLPPLYSIFFFFNDTATTEIYTLSLHDALPISPGKRSAPEMALTRRSTRLRSVRSDDHRPANRRDRKSTRLNSSHLVISYAVFCLKKKKQPTRCYDKLHRLQGPNSL